MKLRSIKELKGVKNKTVLVRLDLNIPQGKIDEEGLFRVKRSALTVKYLLSRQARVAVITHWGSPAGKNNSKFSTKKLAPILEKHWQVPIKFAGQKLKPIHPPVGQVLLYENLRFHRGEEENDLEFAKELANLGYFYVNDAFGVCHRKHASVSAVTKFLPSYAGLLLNEEVGELSQVFKASQPLVVLLGGAKTETKIPLIKNLLPNAEAVLLAGILANTFLVARGRDVGASSYDNSTTRTAHILMRAGKIILPTDVKVIGQAKGFEKVQPVMLSQINRSDTIVDVGPNTLARFKEILSSAKTIVWNGPLGVVEKKAARFGTEEIAKAISKSKAFTVVGGGDTIPVLARLKLLDKIDFVSTGGGAMLAFLGQEEMPGLEPLYD